MFGATALPNNLMQPWWVHLAHLGSSVGIGIGAFAGAAALIPGPWTLPIGVLAGVASIVSKYANAGLASQSK